MLTLERVSTAPENPFSDADSLANSAYLGPDDTGKIAHLLDLDRNVAPLEEFVHDQVKALVMNSRFSCVGAKAAFNKLEYRMGVYAEMGTSGVTRGLAHDLIEFIREQDTIQDHFTTFIATFNGPQMVSEEHFELMLWDQLQKLHEIDTERGHWDPKASANPEDGNFAFSFAGRAFFIIGLHPGASRFARKFAWPTLVFNAHHQFEALKEDGRFERMKTTIRGRDLTLQGTMNATLSNYGEQSEARSYSGRTVEEDWRCPFHASVAASVDEAAEAAAHV